MDINVEKIELRLLKPADYQSLKATMIDAYENWTGAYWKEQHFNTLVDRFPEGQIGVTVNGEIVGCALSIIVDYTKYGDNHTYEQITAKYSFDTHDSDGDVLYGIDVFIRPEYRGMRLARRLYDARKELCENLNLKSIIFGGRIPNYYKYADKLTPRKYIEQVRWKEIHDPVLNFQLSNDFHATKVLKGYLPGDAESKDYAVLLKWDNIYYEAPSEKPVSSKSIVRLGLVQWQMRSYASVEQLIEQATYFVDAVAGYKSDFVLFPEFFNAPLMAAHNKLNTSDAIRKLAEYTDEIREHFSELAVSYNINIITGSMPKMQNGRLYNVGYLCRRNGTFDFYEKIHVTPDEIKCWGMSGGTKVQAFDTDCGKIGIVICYDVEFPELGRILAEQGINMLFVPFLTDTQNGYFRVRHCAQARAIENECYVAIAGSVGNLPNVHNMDIQYAQSAVLTPCDFAFPTNGNKAEATPNSEEIVIANVDLDLLKELHRFGSVRNLKDRRKDLYNVQLSSS